MPNAVRHVALNAVFLDPGVSGGPETYLRGLVPALAAEFPATRLTLLTTRRGAARLVADGWRELADIVALPTDEGERGRRLAAELALVPAAAARRGADVLHSLASLGPFAAGPRTVVTLHDVTFLHTRTFSLATTLAMGGLMLAAAHTADGLLSGSRAARDDVARTLRIDPDEIAVVPHGRGRIAVAVPAVPPVDLPTAARVVVSVSAVRPHKNQALLVRALPLLPADVVLVLAGAHEPYADAVWRTAVELGVQARVRMPGYLSDAELEGLWERAACAALPTLGEGFGLGVLEALDRGVPLACSDLPVLRELGGDVPQYFDPHDPGAAARAITAALDAGHDAPAARAQAGRFTWEEAARGTHAVYERALGR